MTQSGQAPQEADQALVDQFIRLVGRPRHLKNYADIEPAGARGFASSRSTAAHSHPSYRQTVKARTFPSSQGGGRIARECPSQFVSSDGYRPPRLG